MEESSTTSTMAKKASSLKDSLRDLLNPASNVNFGDSDDDFTFAKVVETEENLDQVSESVKKFGNLRKRATLQNFEAKYQGNKISRKNLDGWSDDQIGKNEEISDNSNMDNDRSEAESISSEEVTSNEEEIEADKEEEENDSSDYEDRDEDDSIHESDIDGEMTIDVNSIPKDLMQGDVNKVTANEDVESDEDEGENLFKTKTTDEKRKGKATQFQLKILDNLLEGRIRLQKSLQLTNTLPQHDKVEKFRKEGSSQIKDGFHSAHQSILELLNGLLSLQESLFSSNSETDTILTSIGKEKKSSKQKIKIDNDEEIASDTDQEDQEENSENEENEINGKDESLILPSKRKHTLAVSDYEEELSKRHKAFEDYRDTTIKRWYEKTKLMSGKMSKNFAAFERSTLQQIKQVMTDNDRLIKRTQLKRTPYKVLGKREDENEDLSQSDSHLKDYDAEIFDDGDFYHEMLKELIERKSNIASDDPIASGRKWLELQQLRTKIKRKIDTRASKGRKVRYQVHSKLVSFMAPHEVGTMSDQARNDLFSSLFGGLNYSIPGR